MGNGKVAIGVLRVSTSDQANGVEAQSAALDAWAAREGVQLVACFFDRGVSGATPIDARPGFLGALTALREHGAGLLVAAKRDRIARDVVVAAMAERAALTMGARLVSADGTGNGDTPADAFMRTVVDGAAAYERALIRARTRAALAAKRARGERTGSVPFGFRLAADGVRVEPDEREARVIGRARELRAAGLSTRGIVTALAAEGATSRSGRPLNQTQVMRLLDSTKVAA
jgi:DNA invertase Pin-like site-specific DNA recombinase